MSWTLTAQIALLMFLATMLFVMGHNAYTSNRREDAYKRKENGL